MRKLVQIQQGKEGDTLGLIVRGRDMIEESKFTKL